MAFVSEVTAKMNIDKSGIDAGLTSVVASFGKAGEAVDKQLSKGFGFKKLAKGLLQGIGIGSASDIKEMITKPFEEAAKAAKDIEESTARTLQNYQKLFEARRTDEQNLAENQKQQTRLQRELAELNKPKTEMRFNIAKGIREEVTRPKTKEEVDRTKAIDEELSQLSINEYALKDKIAKAQKTEDERRMRASQEFASKEEALAQKQEEFARSQLSLQEQTAAIQKERADIAERISMSDEDTVDLRERDFELSQQLARIEKERKGLEDERTKLFRSQLSLNDELLDLQNELADLAEATASSGQSSYDIEKRRISLAEEMLRLEKEIADETERRNKEAEDLARNLLKAGEEVTKAKTDFKTELRDRSATTLSELASQRTNLSARNTARNIQRLEEQARRVRLVGGDFRDPSGKIMSREEYADQLITRADRMRQGLGKLPSREKDPMAKAAESIIESEKHLAEIKLKLRPTNIR